MKNWYKFKNLTDKNETTLFIYDEIGLWGVSAQDFCVDLAKVKAKTINLKLNSPGGDVFDGFAIHNSLKDHSAKIHVQVDGLAASSASVIAMAGDEISMAKNSFMMIHNAWTFTGGNSSDLQKMADTLAKIDMQIVETYADRTGIPSDDIFQLMADETWLNAEDAIEKGFADNTVDQEQVNNKFDLTKFAHVPSAVMAMNIKNEPPNERDLETILRDAGLSRTQAKAAVSATKKQTQRDAEQEAKVVASILQATEEYRFIKMIQKEG